MTNARPMTAVEAMRTARQLVANGRSSEAEALYRRIVESQPNFHPAYHGLALLAFAVNKLEVAAELLASAIAINGDVAVYHRDRGEICRRLGRLDEAILEATAATRLAPNEADGYYNLGLAFADREDFASAVQNYRRAVELAPRHGRALNNMGSALEKLDDKTAAAAAYRAAIEIDARHMEAHNNLGSILSHTGDIDGARACFETALALEPRSVVSNYNISALKRYIEADPAVAIVEGLAQTAASLPMTDRTRLMFTLGKIRDDLGQYDGAFAAFAEGNRLQASTLSFNESRAELQTRKIIERFDADLLAAHQGAGNPDPTPVFIVGMPRSGTTLTEQILASHAGAYGAGELKDLHQVVTEVAATCTPAGYPEMATTLSAPILQSIGERYLASIRNIAPAAARVTDKMPGNFHYLGLIRLALPNAKIIHVVRDPMDSCLSCFTHLFNDTMEFAYDLGTLGRYYVRYMTLMQHWQRVLPKGFVLDVRYEDLVTDVEQQTRRMLDHIGLPWDDNCLEFYNNARPVRTASLAQVRRPIYRSSVAGWRRFEKHLAPLLDIVKDYRANE
jgi:tetratricopeptide (TPR) repeat protein